ncbi:MAG: aldo/keto reductase [Gemmatimonas sp.]|nr:aldo/keto reductase [Gemmatimonas sp.]
MRYRLFGRSTGLRVSEIVLGAGNFGTGWGHGAEPAEARSILERYIEAGGNFIDTSDSYQGGQSESLLGGFLKSSRDELIVASKFTQGVDPSVGLSRSGNSRKAMVYSVEQSLKRLQTDRIDLYWVHMPDGMTPVDEIMRGLDDLVRTGKILYIGLSDFPAWRVARAATLAEIRGWTSVAGLQIEYSLVERTSDRELIPMAEAFGLGTVGWSPLGGGVLTGKYRRGEGGREKAFGGRLFHAENTPAKSAILDVTEEIANERGVTSSQVAISWVSTRGVMPIIGPRTPEQLEDNLGAIGLTLSAEHIARLNEVSAVPLGFPHEILSTEGMIQRLAGGKANELERPVVPVL